MFKHIAGNLKILFPVYPCLAKISWFCMLLTTLRCTAPALDEGAIREDGVPQATFQTWQHYLGDPGRSHYSVLNQVDTTNVNQLQVVWIYNSGGLEQGRNTQIQTNPLIVDSVLYGVNPALNLFALNAATGRILWKYGPEDKDGSGLGVNRGLTYWTSADGLERHLFFSSGSFLYAIDPHSGQALAAFGDGGKVDLREGLGRDPKTLSVVANTPGAIYKDLLIMGTRVKESPGAAPGHIRAYDVRTGAQLWEAPLPAGGYATPATYEVAGRQYIVIACGGGKMGTKPGDAYVAFALPDND